MLLGRKKQRPPRLHVMPREVCFCLRGDEPHGHLRAHDDVMFSYFPVLQEFCVTFHLISCFGLIVSRGFLAYLLVLHLTPIYVPCP